MPPGVSSISSPSLRARRTSSSVGAGGGSARALVDVELVELPQQVVDMGNMPRVIEQPGAPEKLAALDGEAELALDVLDERRSSIRSWRTRETRPGRERARRCERVEGPENLLERGELASVGALDSHQDGAVLRLEGRSHRSQCSARWSLGRLGAGVSGRKMWARVYEAPALCENVRPRQARVPERCAAPRSERTESPVAQENPRLRACP